ncbi:MAG: UPF0182 family protein [Chloroflexota bacterium]
MEPVIPIRRARYPRDRAGQYVALSRGIAAGVVVVLVGLGTFGVDLYTDWLWFDSLGLRPVYSTVLLTQLSLFGAGALTFLALYFASVTTARRLAGTLEHAAPPDDDSIWSYIARIGARVGEQQSYGPVVSFGVAILGGLLAIVMGLIASGQWMLALRYLNQQPFGISDPIFGADAGFFIFSLPAYRAVHAWLVGAAILVATTTLAVYAVVTSYELGVSLERVIPRLPLSVKLHIAVLGALVMLLVGANHLMDAFELVYSTRGVAYGGGYSDVRAELPALYVMFAAALTTAVLILGSAFTRTPRMAVVGIAAWGLIALVGGVLFPYAVHQLEVKPNELEKERPYLEHTINFTRRAFDLDSIEERAYAAEDLVTAEEIRSSPETIRNIRLWDHRPLRDTLNQIQSIRSYYVFGDVDVDRYQLEDGYRQVMVAARELDQDRLQSQARTWVNQRLKFTHGYGVAMALVSSVAEEGRPQLAVQDVPPRGSIAITRPEVYFGTRAESYTGYVLIGTTEAEFDYPRGDENVESRHVGRAGVSIGNALARMAYAVRFRDLNLLVSGAVRPETEILYRRSVRERIERIAPFLLQDTDPYIVVADGRLVWMLDAYTTSNAFPYSQPLAWSAPGRGRMTLNYIRNSVKVTVDAYDGTVRFYVTDQPDPLIAAYRAAFPELFLSLSQMPKALRDHIRYPEDLFRMQADRYQVFHMQDTTAYYNREDAWAIPFEKFYERRQPVDPYYVIMRLPDERREEFLLMQPFTPVSKDNMIAWIAARSDAENYGRLLAFKFPKDRLVYGPYQVEGRIDQDPAISAQFTLWSTAGSKVIRGNTLVIPVGGSNLYVEPIYLQSDATNAIPELKRVVVATGNRLVMEPTLEEALNKLFGGGAAPAAAATPRTPAPPAPPAAPTDVAAVVRAANERFTRAQEALRSGDWARYGEEQKALEAELKRLAELTR